MHVSRVEYLGQDKLCRSLCPKEPDCSSLNSYWSPTSHYQRLGPCRISSINIVMSTGAAIMSLSFKEAYFWDSWVQLPHHIKKTLFRTRYPSLISLTNFHLSDQWFLLRIRYREWVADVAKEITHTTVICSLNFDELVGLCSHHNLLQKKVSLMNGSYNYLWV